MRPITKQPFTARSWMLALLIGLIFIGLGYGLRFEIKSDYTPDTPPWLDLTLLLGGYLFAFCLKPIQKTIQRKMCRRATMDIHHKTAR